MSTLITEREMDKMEIEAEMVVSGREEEFEKKFLGNRYVEPLVEDSVEQENFLRENLSERG